MGREQIKAVRICCGYNSDLRIKLKWENGESPYARTIQQFLLDNRHGIFGMFFWENIGATSDFVAGKELSEEQHRNNDMILDFIRKKAFAVCEGRDEFNN